MLGEIHTAPSSTCSNWLVSYLLVGCLDELHKFLCRLPRSGSLDVNMVLEPSALYDNSKDYWNRGEFGNRCVDGIEIFAKDLKVSTSNKSSLKAFRMPNLISLHFAGEKCWQDSFSIRSLRTVASDVSLCCSDLPKLFFLLRYTALSQ